MQNKRGCCVVSERVNSIPTILRYLEVEKDLYTKNQLQTIYTGLSEKHERVFKRAWGWLK
jgi:hypothetical protein